MEEQGSPVSPPSKKNNEFILTCTINSVYNIGLISSRRKTHINKGERYNV